MYCYKYVKMIQIKTTKESDCDNTNIVCGLLLSDYYL